MPNSNSSILYWTAEDVQKYVTQHPETKLPILDGWAQLSPTGGIMDVGMDFDMLNSINYADFFLFIKSMHDQDNGLRIPIQEAT